MSVERIKSINPPKASFAQNTRFSKIPFTIKLDRYIPMLSPTPLSLCPLRIKDQWAPRLNQWLGPPFFLTFRPF